MNDAQKKLQDPGNNLKSYHDILTALILKEMVTFVYMNWNSLESKFPANVLNNIDAFLESLRDLEEYIGKRGSIEQEILATYDDNFYKIGIFPRKTAKWRRREMSDNISRVVMPLITAFYTLARLIIIALAFSCLRAMPAGVYETTWTNYLPKLD